ncbi:MAG: glucosaminidase domain-containing protein [Bacteroidales bacterium]|jgi:hypothetical protein|nr:glucosaminidase domain-containing protein [Bacteroidales bacterium]
MSKASDYADRYAEAAMEQMRKYGIPASVTLAQGILESASGQSELSRKGNNHFGIKATKTWLDGGGRYLVYTDDKPNEKFCQYASVADSYEHHSLFLRGNRRYANLFELSPDDYVGWTRGLQADGYATSQQYAASLQSIIKANGLDRYDRQVMQEKGWKSTVGRTATTADLAANSKAVLGEQPAEARPEQAQEEKQEAQPETPKEKDYFNTIRAEDEGQAADPWRNFFGMLGDGGGYASADPVVELASTLFATLMAVAIQIDGMGEAQEIRQAEAPQASVSEADALASKNFEAGMNSMNNNPIKRTRS